MLDHAMCKAEQMKVALSVALQKKGVGIEWNRLDNSIFPVKGEWFGGWMF